MQRVKKKKAEVTESEILAFELRAINDEHEKQMESSREMYLHFVEQLQGQYKEQLLQMENSFSKLKEHYDRSMVEIKNAYEKEIFRDESNIRQFKTMSYILVSSLALTSTALILLLAI